MRSPTYSELLKMREREWEKAQKEAARRRDLERARIADMPDVTHRPIEGEPYEHAAIVCPCGGKSFVMERWVTVNGVRHRMQVKCTACSKSRTWDWNVNMKQADIAFIGWLD